MAVGPWRNGGHIHLKNIASNKNLKFNGNHVTADGGQGKPATWRVHRLNPGNKPQHVKLENVAHPGNYLCINKNGDLMHGKGGKWCEFLVEKKNNNFILIAKQNTGHHVGFKNDGSIKPPKNVGGGNHAQFQVIISSAGAPPPAAAPPPSRNNNNCNKNNNRGGTSTSASIVVVSTEPTRPYLYRSTTLTNQTTFPFTIYSYNECDGIRLISNQKKDLLPSSSISISAKGYDGLQIDIYNGKERLHRFFAQDNSRYNVTGQNLGNISVAPVVVVEQHVGAPPPQPLPQQQQYPPQQQYVGAPPPQPYPTQQQPYPQQQYAGAPPPQQQPYPQPYATQQPYPPQQQYAGAPPPQQQQQYYQAPQQPPQQQDQYQKTFTPNKQP